MFCRSLLHFPPPSPPQDAAMWLSTASRSVWASLPSLLWVPCSTHFPDVVALAALGATDAHALPRLAAPVSPSPGDVRALLVAQYQRCLALEVQRNTSDTCYRVYGRSTTRELTMLPRELQAW